MIQHNDENDPLFFYYSSDSSTGDTPLLSITYITDEIGVNPYWGYANTPVGSVNTDNGNLVTSVTDFSLPGRGIPINVTRTYNSRAASINGSLNSIFGQKWFSNLDMQLIFKSWGVVFLDSTQTERPFMLNSDGVTYTAPDNYPLQLYKGTLNGSTVYNIQEANDVSDTYQPQLPTLTFNTSGQLIQLSDGKGNVTSITWSSSSITIQDPSGRTATLSRNADGTVSQITTSAESGVVKASYTYSDGFLTSVTYDNGSYPSATIHYNWNNGYLFSLTDKNGTKQIINYDSNDRVMSVGPVNMLSNPSMEASSSTDASAPDNWSPTILSDAGYIQQSSTAKYGRFSLNLHSAYKSGTSGNSYLYATQTIPVSPNQTYTLSSLIKTVNLGGSSTPNISSAEAFINTDQLGSSGNDLSFWNDSRPSGVSGTTDWTPNTVTVTTSSSTYYLVVYVEIQHDPTHFTGDAYFDGVQLESGSTTTAFEGHTDFRYGNDNGFKSVWVTAPDGEVTEYKNDNYGTPVAVINDPRDGNPVSETDLSWNAADRLLSLTTPDQVNTKSGKSYSYQYDALGNMTKATDPLNNSTSMNYYYNHLQTLTQADGSTVQHIWDPVNLNEDTTTDQTLDSQAYSYNEGNVTTESNLLGVADNRVLNGSFEQLSGNQPVNWSASSSSGAYNQVDDVSVTGTADSPFADSSGNSHVLHINPGTNSYAYQWTNYINLTGPTTDPFTVSAYLKTGQTGTSDGACINVYWYQANSDGTPSSSYFAVTRLFNVHSTNWQRYVATVSPPSAASYAKVMAITYGPYDGYFDNIQFEKSQLARGYNMLENSSFEQGATQWSNSDNNAQIVNDGTSNAYSGSYDAQINLSIVGTSYFKSLTVLPANPGQYYTLLGYIKTNNIIAGSGGGGARLHVYFYDSSGNPFNSYATPLISQTSRWTKYVLPFTPPANTVTMQVWLELYNAQGTAVFDNIRLSPGNLTTTASYDLLNNYIASTSDPLGNTTNYQNDPYGQPTQVTAPSGSNTYFTYDGQERLRTVKDNAGNTTTYNLDANGNVLSDSLASGTTNYDSESFTYDRDNNLTSQTDADNNTTQYSYDQENKLTQKTNPNGTSVSAGYDDYGNLNKISLSGGPTYNLGYDLEGHLTSSSIVNGPSNTYGYDAVGNMTSYVEKDANDNTVTTVGAPTAPNGATMYSSLNQLLGFNLTYGTNSPITYNFSYAKNGLVSSVMINPGSSYQQQVNFNYDESNNLVSKVNPNNTQDDFTYDDANRVTETKTVDNNDNLKWSSQYSYANNDGKDGRLTSVTGTDPGGNTYKATYIYNNTTEKLNRLTQAAITDGSYSGTFNYSYDPAGNLLTMDVANGTSAPNQETFTYDADNRITSINGNSSAVSYEGNNNTNSDGNITKLTLNGVTRYYTYDSANRLIAVGTTPGASDIASYTYDAVGNRLTKTANGVTITYHYFDGQLWYETQSGDASNVIHALYLRSPNGQLEAVSLNYVIGGTSNAWYYYHYNTHGDVIAVTDGSGNVYRQYTYDPYGNLISMLGPKGQPVKDKDGNNITTNIQDDPGFNNSYLYAGYRYDSETGLYFLNSRYYAPEIGRFLTKDSVLGDPSNPDTLNRYAYCRGDPVNNVDPSGTSSVSDFFNGILNIALGIGTAIATDGADPEAEEELTTGAEEISVAVDDLIEGGASDVGDTIEPVDSGASDSGIVDDGAGDAGGSVADNTAETVNAGEHTVYSLRDPITNEVKYVGRTINPVAREAAHKLVFDKAILVFQPEYEGLSYEQARGTEQLLFDQYGGLDNLLNKIRPISLKNPNLNKYLDAAMKLVDSFE